MMVLYPKEQHTAIKTFNYSLTWSHRDKGFNFHLVGEYAQNNIVFRFKASKKGLYTPFKLEITCASTQGEDTPENKMRAALIIKAALEDWAKTNPLIPEYLREEVVDAVTVKR
jgi:hypothetical protein